MALLAAVAYDHGLDGVRALRLFLVPVDSQTKLIVQVAWNALLFAATSIEGIYRVEHHLDAGWLTGAVWALSGERLFAGHGCLSRLLQSANAGKPQAVNDSPEERQNINKNP